MTLKDLLKEKDMHGAQLARRIGKDRSVVSRWASGKSKPRKEIFSEIAKALGVTEDVVEACFKEKESV